jgi:hypothetical protein
VLGSVAGVASTANNSPYQNFLGEITNFAENGAHDNDDGIEWLSGDGRAKEIQDKYGLEGTVYPKEPVALKGGTNKTEASCV